MTGLSLKPNGESISLSLENVGEFLDLVCDAWLGDGVERQIEAVRAGFAEVASTSSGTCGLTVSSQAIRHCL